MRFRFLRSVLVLTLVCAGIMVYPTMVWATPDVARSIIAAGAIAFFNVVLGCAVLEWGIDKSNSVFMYSVFGGMGVRMALILVALTVLLVSDFHALSLALALMGFYVLSMITEIYFVLRELNRRPSGRKVRGTSSDSLAQRTIAVNTTDRR